MAVILGSNDFFGVPFPLVVADRFFRIYSTGKHFGIDVFRWDTQTKEAVYEVKASKPLNKNISTNPTGIVTFSESPTGAFLYKFRPKPGVSQIFGKVPMNEEVEVRISDREIVVLRSGTPMCTLQRNQLTGMPIGIQVDADGSFAIGGVNRLPDGMILTRRPQWTVGPEHRAKTSR